VRNNPGKCGFRLSTTAYEFRRSIEGFGLDPEPVLVKDAISEGNRGVVIGDSTEDQVRMLWTVLKWKLMSELKGENL
jgi:hypothetical protein